MRPRFNCIAVAAVLLSGTVATTALSNDPSPNAATSQAFYTTMSAGDMDGWIGTMAPDVVTHEPVGTPPNEGHAGVMAWMQRNAAMGLTSVHVDVDQMIPAGQEIAILWTARFTLANEAEITMSGIDIHRFNDLGQIVEVRGYFDPSPMMAAMAGDDTVGGTQ